MSDDSANLDRYEHLPFAVELELGSVAVGLENLLRLREGDMLRTDLPAGAPVTVMAGGVTLGAAELITVKEKAAARIVTAGPKGSNGRP